MYFPCVVCFEPTSLLVDDPLEEMLLMLLGAEQMYLPLELEF